MASLSALTDIVTLYLPLPLLWGPQIDNGAQIAWKSMSYLAFGSRHQAHSL